MTQIYLLDLGTYAFDNEQYKLAISSFNIAKKEDGMIFLEELN